MLKFKNQTQSDLLLLVINWERFALLVAVSIFLISSFFNSIAAAAGTCPFKQSKQNNSTEQQVSRGRLHLADLGPTFNVGRKAEFWAKINDIDIVGEIIIKQNQQNLYFVEVSLPGRIGQTAGPAEIKRVLGPASLTRTANSILISITDSSLNSNLKPGENLEYEIRKLPKGNIEGIISLNLNLPRTQNQKNMEQSFSLANGRKVIFLDI